MHENREEILALWGMSCASVMNSIFSILCVASSVRNRRSSRSSVHSSFSSMHDPDAYKMMKKYFRRQNAKLSDFRIIRLFEVRRLSASSLMESSADNKFYISLICDFFHEFLFKQWWSRSYDTCEETHVSRSTMEKSTSGLWYAELWRKSNNRFSLSLRILRRWYRSDLDFFSPLFRFKSVISVKFLSKIYSQISLYIS